VAFSAAPAQPFFDNPGKALDCRLCAAPRSTDCWGVSPAHAERIEVRVAELQHLFNAIDPSPLPKKDLDAKVEEFIVSWARDARRDAALSLVVYVDGPGGDREDATVVHETIRAFFNERSLASKRRLRQLFRVGRTSLAIGFVFLAVSVLVGGLVEGALVESRLGVVLRESLLIGGWVAMWRPLEIFLYDWWPIRADGRLFARLAAMPVRIEHAQ
jgi:hypothetical protein